MLPLPLAASLRSQERVRRAAPAGSVAVVWLLLLSGFGGLLVGRLARAELLLQVIRCVLFPLFRSRVCNLQICARYACHCNVPGPSDCSAYSLFPCCVVCLVWPLVTLVLDLFLPFPAKKYGRLVLAFNRWQDLQGLQHYFVRVLHNEAPLRTMIRNMVRRTALQQLHTQRLRNQLPDLFGCLFWQQNLNHNAAANCLCYTISQLRIPLQKKH